MIRPFSLGALLALALSACAADPAAGARMRELGDTLQRSAQGFNPPYQSPTPPLGRTGPVICYPGAGGTYLCE